MESDKALYDAVLKRMKETDTTKDSRAEEIRVVDLATVPAAPAKPRTKLILALAIVGSLGFGVGLAFLLSMLDSSFKTVDEAEADLGLPAVGAPAGAPPAAHRQPAGDCGSPGKRSGGRDSDTANFALPAGRRDSSLDHPLYQRGTR